MSYDAPQGPNSGSTNPPYSGTSWECSGQPQILSGEPPQGPYGPLPPRQYGQPQIPYE